MSTVYNDGFTKINWNESATFNVYFDMGNGFKEVDVFTVYGIKSQQEAALAAFEHATEINETLEG